MDLLEAMTPEFTDVNDEEAYMAATGSNRMSAAVRFTGGYAETPEQTARRASPKVKAATETKLSRGLADTILTLPRGDKEELDRIISHYQKAYGGCTRGEAVLQALRTHVP